MKNKVVINKASSPKSLSPSVFIGDPIGDLQRSVILETATTTTHVEDSRTLRAARHSGMTTLFNGLAFTLIELLVVVLIIGILAAVAVPQYQKAVWRSRNVQLKNAIRAIGNAQKVYKMANGEYAPSFEDLGINMGLAQADIDHTNDTVCSLVLAAAGAVHRGDSFQLVLGTEGVAYALWVKGPYKCTGFSWLPSDNIRCVEAANGKASISSGDFCKKIENADSFTEFGAWRFWK